jgi:dihydroneopterin aldolase
MARAVDHIFIRDFRLQTLIGFHRRERVVPQTIRLDLEIGIANRAVFTSDKVADCIDYDKVTARIREIATEHVNLVETLADRVARLVLEETGLLPHTNVGVVSAGDSARAPTLNVSTAFRAWSAVGRSWSLRVSVVICRSLLVRGTK